MNEYKIFQYKWDISLIGKLYQDHGSKVITLQSHFGISRGILKSSLERLLDVGLVMENPGYGHPMRAEYILTSKGQALGPFCIALLEEGRKKEITEIFENKWSCPIIIKVGEHIKRFNELKNVLAPVTSRALSTNLKFLHEAKCLKREIFDSHPPLFIYSLERKSRGIFSIYKEHENFLKPLKIV